MTSRGTRSRLGATSARGPCRPGLTRTQAMRQAKAAMPKERPREEAMRGAGPCPPRRQRSGLAKLGPPPSDPKRINFTKPALTKAMIARMQHAQKLRAEEEQRKCQEEIAASRRPRRTTAPIGGDARAGKERPPRQWQPEGPLQESAMRSPTIRKMMQSRDQRAKGVSGAQRKGLSTSTATRASAEAANRSIQVIQETLDEQEAVECVAVQNKLQDFQEARREFVMAVANVSGNAGSFADEISPPFSPSSPPGSPLAYMPGPLPSEPPTRYLQKIPDLDDPYLQVEYDRYHPSVAAGREFLKRSQAAQAQRDAQRRLDEEFARAASRIEDDDLRFDIPLEQDLMEGDISFEEDEDGTMMPCTSRIRASMPPIPQRENPYPYRPTDIDELERFFDTTNYPPVTSTFAPPGRENMHPDFWELEDPWYRECPQPDVPDLMEFDLMDF